MKYRFQELLDQLRSNISRISCDSDQCIYYILRKDSDGEWDIIPKKGKKNHSRPSIDLPSIQYEDIDRASFPGDETDRLILERLFPASEEHLLNNPRSPSRLGDVLNLFSERKLWVMKPNFHEVEPVEIANHTLETRLKFLSGTSLDSSSAPLSLGIRLVGDGEKISPAEAEVISLQPFWILHQKKLFRVQSSKVEAIFLKTFPKGAVPIQKENLSFINNKVLPEFEKHDIVPEVSRSFQTSEPPSPVPLLQLEKQEGDLCIELKFSYAPVDQTSSGSNAESLEEFSNQEEGDHSCLSISKSNCSRMVCYDNTRENWMFVKRNLEKENEYKEKLLSLNLDKVHSKDQILFTDGQNTLSWLLQHQNFLEEQGFYILQSGELNNHISFEQFQDLHLSVSKSDPFLELQGVIEFDHHEIRLKDLPENLLQGSKYVKLSDRTFGVLPRDWEALYRLMKWAKSKEDHLELPAFSTPLIQKLLDRADQKERDEEFKHLHEKLSKRPEMKKIKEPEAFRGKLRSYQKEGIAWLYFLRKQNLNGILADDMGLGKTIQILAFMQHLRENSAIDSNASKFLVVCPRSVLKNWKKEANRFTPRLSVYVHHGQDRFQHSEQFPEKDLFLTTYGTLREDIEWINSINFDTIVLDESQKIRNPSTQISKAVRTLSSKHKICLTGTPIQNSTMDLWSQFEFFHPGFLGPQTYFQKNVVQPLENGSSSSGQSNLDQDDHTAEKLQTMIKPLLLRRTKDSVEKELPPLTRVTLECPFSSDQERIYEEVRSHYRKAIFQQKTNTVGKATNAQMKILEGLTRLRQVCCDPRILDKECEKLPTKIRKFLEITEELVRSNHKLLVFSQFVQFLSQIEDVVQEQNWNYEYLDGSTRDRIERIKNFQTNPDISLFLISLKAGGEGINLTAADYIIFLDPWWNPAAEKQATDRTHRIGQENRVIVYRLYCPNTVEEKILKLQKKKRNLSEKLISPNTNWWNELSKKEIESLFKKQNL